VNDRQILWLDLLKSRVQCTSIVSGQCSTSKFTKLDRRRPPITSPAVTDKRRHLLRLRLALS